MGKSANVENAIKGFRDGGLFPLDVSKVICTVKMEPSKVFTPSTESVAEASSVLRPLDLNALPDPPSFTIPGSETSSVAAVTTSRPVAAVTTSVPVAAVNVPGSEIPSLAAVTVSRSEIPSVVAVTTSEPVAAVTTSEPVAAVISSPLRPATAVYVSELEIPSVAAVTVSSGSETSSVVPVSSGSSLFTQARPSSSSSSVSPAFNEVLELPTVQQKQKQQLKGCPSLKQLLATNSDRLCWKESEKRRKKRQQNQSVKWCERRKRRKKKKGERKRKRTRKVLVAEATRRSSD